MLPTNPQPAHTPLFGQSEADLTNLMADFGQPRFRAAQLALALYRRRATSLSEISTLPSDLRHALTQHGHAVGLPEIVQTATSVDGTERYLIRMADGETVETVWMPDGDGTPTEFPTPASTSDAEAGAPSAEQTPDAPNFRRATVCISSQVGCAVNCQFCLTARLGIRRNLTPGEIAGQVAAVLNRHDLNLGSTRGNPTPPRINLVFMGMGEPFLNYDNFIAAVHLLAGPMQIPTSRMTVSTSGIEPSIRRFALEPVRPHLALSLNASNDLTRAEIMPITRKWNIEALLQACRTLPLRTREWVTFEYVLLGGINDQPQHTRELLHLLQSPTSPLRDPSVDLPPTRVKVNLIVWNPGPDMPYTQPNPADVRRFQQTLIAAGIPTYIRRPRGRDIYAACGQLKRTVDLDPLTPPPPTPLIAIAPRATPPL